jgi:hypothetical protein
MSVILKDKFSFGPQDYSNYFAFVGLFYAASQLLSKRLINRFSADPTWMVIICTLFLMTVPSLSARPPACPCLRRRRSQRRPAAG